MHLEVKLGLCFSHRPIFMMGRRHVLVEIYVAYNTSLHECSYEVSFTGLTECQIYNHGSSCYMVAVSLRFCINYKPDDYPSNLLSISFEFRNTAANFNLKFGRF